MSSRMRIAPFGLVIVVTCGMLPSAAAGQEAPATPAWQAPLGIPVPPFGIAETAPAPPAPWTAPMPGFYYVDEQNSLADDFANPYGYPGKPRRTIPSTLPAGSVVEVHGVYSRAQTSPNGINAQGTAAAPVFIRGASTADRPYLSACWEVSGSYVIVENVELGDCGGFVFLAPAHHAALRHSNLHGTPSGGGFGIQSWNGTTAHDVVVYHNRVHHMGDVHATYDQDNHGIAIGAHVNHVWVVDNSLYGNSGDGIQINAGSRALQSTTHHIYVGRNRAWSNKQSGFWVKQAVDVIFSENLSAHHHPSNSSLGACMGGQYAPEFVWFVNNQVWDCDYGIQIASDSGLGNGSSVFVVGNIVARIHDSNSDFNPNSAWHNCGISLVGGTHRYVIENDVYDVDSGICVPYGAHGVVYLYDNLVQQVRPNGYHVFVEPLDVAQASIGATSNLFAPDYRLNVAGQSYHYPAGTNGPNSVVADVGWASPDTGDFHLKASSPALDDGVVGRLPIWSIFQNRYGLSINRDVYGTPRPTATKPDIGAVERP